MAILIMEKPCHDRSPIPALSTLDSMGKYGVKEQVLTGCEEMTKPTCVRWSRVAWKCGE